MTENSTKKLSFIQQMDCQLLQYKLEKALRQQQKLTKNKHHHCKEIQAKDILIELDNQNQISRNLDDDIYIGGWSSYKVPEKIQERLSLSKKTKKELEKQSKLFQHPPQHKQSLRYTTQSQKNLRKLKVSLHQLEAPLHLPPGFQPNKKCQSQSKINHVGIEALVISNKQEIRPSLKSERKSGWKFEDKGSENNRPHSNSNITGKNGSSGYQKIKRNFGFGNHIQEGEILYEKQILSQLLKNNVGKGQAPGLQSMLNYFTLAGGGDSRRKTQSKLGLDKILS